MFDKKDTIGPWLVKDGSVDLNGGDFQSSPAGGNSVDLDGEKNGTLVQEITTEKDAEYVLSFALSGNWDAGEVTKKLEVKLGDLKETISIRRPSGWSRQNMLWVPVEFPYVGNGKKVKLELKSKSDKKSQWGAVVADVSVALPEEIPSAPSALDTIPVPMPKNLNNYVRNKEAAILLGKSLFWDMQVGSDGKTACATCHWHAGADARTRNTLRPGAPGSAFGPQRDGQLALAARALQKFRGANKDLNSDDFPFHKVKFPTHKGGDDNPVVRDTMEVVGSQGVVKKDFNNIVEGSPRDDGTLVSDPVFNVDGANARQVTGRNTPTTINAVFNDRQFWDGRANRYFNGVNPFGDLDKDARVWVNKTSNSFEDQLNAVFEMYPWLREYESVLRKYTWLVQWFLGDNFEGSESIERVRILIDNASLASQAVGPPLSDVEMSWLGRSFPELGRKMFSLPPLALQEVHEEDGVLGDYANHGGTGLKSGVNYPRLIRQAFQEKWWKSEELTPDGFTQMEANFTLFWGLAINLYEATLVSDDTPFDHFSKGNEESLSESARRGLKIFLNEGKCIVCHEGPEFTGATISALRGARSNEADFVEFMAMQQGPKAFYDNGFYNIGVRPTLEDIGVGASHPDLGPLSYTRRRQQGQNIGQDIKVPKDGRVAVDGAFKTPTLRNIELTGPYMHNGGMKSLTEVVQFYTRRADFFKENIDDLDPDVNGISELQGDDEKIQDVVNFLKSLTDERVRRRCAPFDHPELVIPNGHYGVDDGVALDNAFTLPAVGRDGGEPLKTFVDTLRD
tara:strand:- start:21823 stop:24201 length:2379 start_codon:yes stop_codon:yes gene_type:complete